MPFKSIKNKINSLASGEVLGETTNRNESNQEERQVPKREPKPQKEKTKKEPKPQNTSKERKVSKDSFFKRKEIEVEEEIAPAVKSEESRKQNTEDSNKILMKESVEGYEDVLSILNIKENVQLKLDFESKDLDYVEFSQTTPLGFDFDEVTDFISRMKYILNKYELTLKQRNKDVVILASEVKKVEQRMVEQNQAKELEKMVGGMTEEERLIEENMDLKVELNNLKMQINNKNDNSKVLEKLQKEIEALRAENQILTLKQVQGKDSDSFILPTPESPTPQSKNTLPSFDIDKGLGLPGFEEDNESLDKFMNSEKPKKDSFESMMDDIGGNYND